MKIYLFALFLLISACSNSKNIQANEKSLKHSKKSIHQKKFEKIEDCLIDFKESVIDNFRLSLNVEKESNVPDYDLEKSIESIIKGNVEPKFSAKVSNKDISNNDVYEQIASFDVTEGTRYFSLAYLIKKNTENAFEINVQYDSYTEEQLNYRISENVLLSLQNGSCQYQFIEQSRYDVNFNKTDRKVEINSKEFKDNKEERNNLEFYFSNDDYIVSCDFLLENLDKNFNKFPNRCYFVDVDETIITSRMKTLSGDEEIYKVNFDIPLIAPSRFPHFQAINITNKDPNKSYVKIKHIDSEEETFVPTSKEAFFTINIFAEPFDSENRDECKIDATFVRNFSDSDFDLDLNDIDKVVKFRIDTVRKLEFDNFKLYFNSFEAFEDTKISHYKYWFETSIKSKQDLLNYLNSLTPEDVSGKIDPKYDNYLEATEYIDFLDPEILSHTQEIEKIMETQGLNKNRMGYTMGILLFLNKHFTYNFAAKIYKDQAPYKTSELINYDKLTCGQYSILFTAFARYFQIPSRIILGYRLRSSEPHAWVEIFIDGINWIPLEPQSPVFSLLDFSYFPLTALDDSKMNYDSFNEVFLHVFTKGPS